MTSKTETAKQLMVLATDGDRLPSERLAALEQADRLRKELKVGWTKVCGMDAVGVDEMRADLLEYGTGAPDGFEMTQEELADQALRPRADATDPSMPMGEEGNELVEELPSKEFYRGHHLVPEAGGGWGVVYAGDVVHEGIESLELAREHVDHFHSMREEASAAVDSLSLSDAPTDDEPPSPPEAPVALTAAERGAIGVMSRDLLQTDEPYESIALSIRARYPHARTTARSLASVAADMRRDGIPCPPRRKSK